MTEADYTRKLRGALHALPRTHFDKIHGGPYQTTGISDLLGCIDGIYIAIEVKAEDRRGKSDGGLTLLQLKFLNTVANAGGIGMVIYSDEDPEAAAERVHRASKTLLGTVVR